MIPAKRTLSISCLLILVGHTLGIADDTSKFQQILSRSRNGVGFVESYNSGSVSSGTGFLYRDRQTLITNYHVINNAQNVFVELPGVAAPISCQLLDGRPDLDLAALRLSQPAPAENALLSLPDDNDYEPKQLDKILVVGNPRDLKQTPLLGVFSAHRDPPDLLSKRLGITIPVFQLQIPGAGGQSGSPVMDLSGDMIGVFFAGEGRGEFDLNYAIPHRNVKLLAVSNAPRPFSNLPNIPDISSEFAGTGVSNLSNMRTLQVGPQDGTISLASKHWGFASHDPDQIFREYVDDLPRFATLIPKDILAQVVQRKNLLIVTNAAYGYRVLVPQGYTIDERNVPGSFFESRISFPNSNGGVRIVAFPIVPAQSDAELQLAFDHNVRKHANLVLGRNIVLAPPLLNPNEVFIDPNPLLTDRQPRINMRTGDLRLWRHYRTAPVMGDSHLVMYRIRGDLFLAVDIFFPTPILAAIGNPNIGLPQRFVEDMLIANSFVDMY